MHCLIPHASALSPDALNTLRTQRLPHLQRLLARGTAQAMSEGEAEADEWSLTMPHERALARLQGDDPSAPPLAAWAVPDAGALPWARLTPLHIAVAADGVQALAPAALALQVDERDAIAVAIAPLFPAQDGWRTHGLEAGQSGPFYVAHTALEGLEAASLERIVDRPLPPWLPPSRLLKQLGNEIQMTLHALPLNAARDAAGQLTVNAVWIDGIGATRTPAGTRAPVHLLDALREPALSGDWRAWACAWAALDAGPLKTLADAPDARLTLCGERRARTWLVRQRPWWRPRWPTAIDPLSALEAL